MQGRANVFVYMYVQAFVLQPVQGNTYCDVPDFFWSFSTSTYTLSYISFTLPNSKAALRTPAAVHKSTCYKEHNIIGQMNNQSWLPL